MMVVALCLLSSEHAIQHTRAVLRDNGFEPADLDPAGPPPGGCRIAVVERTDWEDPSVDRIRAHLAWAGIEAPLVVVVHGRDDLLWRLDGIRCVVDAAELPAALDACVKSILAERAAPR